MTTTKEWLALAERCEGATVTDREIDVAILVACGWKIERRERDRKEWLYSPNDEYYRQDPLFLDMTWRISRSLDAITALIERELNCSWRAGNTPSGRGFALLGTNTKEHAAISPALALCAAFCRAKAAGA